MEFDLSEREADAAAARGDFARARTLLCDVVAARPEAFDPHVKLSAILRVMGEAQASLTQLDRALALRPLDFTALLMKATQLHGLGRIDDAGLAYGHALAQAPDPAPAALAPILAVARARYGAWQNRHADRLQVMARTSTQAPLSEALARFITNVVRLTEPDRDGPTHYCYPGLPEIPFYDRGLFDWLDRLEAATPVIQQELEAVLHARAAQSVPYIQYPDTAPVAQWAHLNHNADWSAIHLTQQGRRIAGNAALCPRTMAILDRLPQPAIPGAGPNAMFSLLAPSTHIPPHTGVANTRLVCHLPLIVPPGCWFRVGQERREWVPGTAWIFDDTIEHEAMNPTDVMRVILIFDIWHPALSDQERGAVSAIIGAGGQVHGL